MKVAGCYSIFYLFWKQTLFERDDGRAYRTLHHAHPLLFILPTLAWFLPSFPSLPFLPPNLHVQPKSRRPIPSPSRGHPIHLLRPHRTATTGHPECAGATLHHVERGACYRHLPRAAGACLPVQVRCRGRRAQALPANSCRPQGAARARLHASPQAAVWQRLRWSGRSDALQCPGASARERWEELCSIGMGGCERVCGRVYEEADVGGCDGYERWMAVGEYGQCQCALGLVVDSHQGYVSLIVSISLLTCE